MLGSLLDGNSYILLVSGRSMVHRRTKVPDLLVLCKIEGGHLYVVSPFRSVAAGVRRSGQASKLWFNRRSRARDTLARLAGFGAVRWRVSDGLWRFCAVVACRLISATLVVGDDGGESRGLQIRTFAVYWAGPLLEAAWFPDGLELAIWALILSNPSGILGVFHPFQCSIGVCEP